VIDYWYPHHLHAPHSNNYLYLDDLEVSDYGKLTIRNWQLGRDHLLVRKGSEHLIDSLNRIKFEEHWEWKAALKDYNRDYWQLIPGIPEPSTYGVVCGAVVAGLALIRRKRGFQPKTR